MQRLKVTTSCPSCGAPFEFLEGSNVSLCPFCNQHLLFQPPDKILRYCLEPKLTRKEVPFIVDRFRKEQNQLLTSRIDEIKLYYLPYWRFTAQIFYTLLDFNFSASLQDEKEIVISTKEWDINFPAHISNDLSLDTLGMRPDCLKLKLLTSKNLVKDGEVLNMQINSSQAKEKALKSLNFFMNNKKKSEQELVLKLLDENLSLIYFPLWVVNFISSGEKAFQIIDGITCRTLSQSPGYFEPKLNGDKEERDQDSLRILPHRCPSCGWDLPASPFHLIFPCENCQKIWRISVNSYQSVNGEIVKPPQELSSNQLKPSEYYPFWIFQTRPCREKSFSIQNLSELFPSEIGWFKVKDKSRPFLFYIPAFEIKNLNKVPGISLTFTRIQPELETELRDRQKLAGAIRSDEDAKKIAELLWLGLIYSKHCLQFEEWKEIILENPRLIWLPYTQECAFLKDSILGYSFQKTESHSR
jgi:predicted RNA-binding Zn-ribbon protein involved in translation (DUF1610 family)